MIIGIDISAIPYGTGVSNYTLNLVRSLLKNDKNNSYKLFFSSLRRPLPPEIKQLTHHHSFKIYHHRLPPTLLAFLWNRLHILPIELFIGKCDIFHTSDWTQPPTFRAKTVTTIHDLVPFLFPQTLHPKIVSTHYHKLRQAVKFCHHFISVSQNTQNDLLKIFPKIKPSQTSVIYEAAENKYSRFLKLPTSAQNQAKQKITKLYDLNNFFLAQGTREPRKNLKRLIDAFIKFKNKYPKSTHQLAISGKYGWGEDINHLKHPYIKILGFIPEKDMVALHASAFCLVYPSLYEGFGLPLVKSLAVGVPIICSHTSSLPEIVGSAALLVDPNSVEDIAQAITKISLYPKLRQELISAGLSQVKKFSWDNTALQTLSVYNQVNTSK